MRVQIAAAVDSTFTTFKVIGRLSFDCDRLVLELNEENDYGRERGRTTTESLYLLRAAQCLMRVNTITLRSVPPASAAVSCCVFVDPYPFRITRTLTTPLA